MMRRAALALCVCVPLSALAEPAHLTGREIGDLLPGSTIQIDAPFGYKLPVRFGADGALTGEAGDLSSYLGSPTDTGKWWVKGDQVCHKWSRWLDRQLQCMRLRREGRILHWTSQDGNTGTATITVLAPPRAPEASPALEIAAVHSPPKIIAAAPAPAAREAVEEKELPGPLPPPALAAPPPPVAVPPKPAAANPQAPPPRAPPMASAQPVPGVRMMAFPPVTAPKTGTQVGAQSASFVVTNVRENDVLNVRNGPSTEYDIVASLRPGSRGVSITGECQAEWCPVRHQDGAGWVNRTFLSSETPQLVQAAMRAPDQVQGALAQPAKTPITAYRGSPDAPRTCLTAAARALLQTIETRFGPVRVVSTCRAGATIAGTGRPSRHASGNAVDFDAGGRKAEILRWLIANHRTGGVMTYPDMDHIHVDIGPHFVSIAGGQHSASWRNNRSSRGEKQDEED